MEITNNTAATSQVVTSNSRERWHKFDIMWMLNLFGTAVGAGILFLPITAGMSGLWPLVIITLIVGPMTYFAHRGLARLVLASSLKDGDITNVTEEFFGKSAGLIITALYFFAIYPILLIYGVSITNTVDSFIVNQLHMSAPPRVILAGICVFSYIAIIICGEKLVLLKGRIAGIGHNIVREIEHLLEDTGREVENKAHTGRYPLEVPDVGNGNGKVDMTHTLAAHLGAGDLDSAALADLTLEADLLIFSAVALPVLRRPEDPFAEKTVALGLEGAVVDGLRLLDLAVGPFSDHLRRSDANLNGVKRCITHLLFLLLCVEIIGRIRVIVVVRSEFIVIVVGLGTVVSAHNILGVAGGISC